MAAQTLPGVPLREKPLGMKVDSNPLTLPWVETSEISSLKHRPRVGYKWRTRTLKGSFNAETPSLDQL